MYQQPIYYTQPVLISSPHPMQSYPQQQQQTYQQQGVGSPNDVDNNNMIGGIGISSSAQNSPVDANNNTTFIPPNHTATTNVVPSTYGLGGIPPHQGGGSYVPTSSTGGANTQNLMGAPLSYAQGVPTEVRPYAMKGKANGMSNPLPPQIHHSNNNNNAANIMINGAPIMPNGPTQLMSVHPHNGGTTATYVTSAALQNQNQNQPMYTVHPQQPSGPQFVQHMTNQPREIVQI